MRPIKLELAVSETFYSLQGEGITMGIPSVFLRLKSCNLLCGGQGTVEDKGLHNGATWRCDTIEVWLQGQRKKHEDVLSKQFIDKLDQGAHLIITGGEPLLQQGAIDSYLWWLSEEMTEGKPVIEIETNGTIPPRVALQQWVDYWNCSPKLSNSGIPFEKRFNALVIKEMNEYDNVIFKFVVTGVEDWVEIEKFFLPIINRDKIWLMPGASSIEELLDTNRIVAEIAKDQCVRFCSRLQIEIWNQTTGV